MCKLDYPLTLKPSVLFTVDHFSGVGRGDVHHVSEVRERQWINDLHDYHKVESHMDSIFPVLESLRKGQAVLKWTLRHRWTVCVISQLVIYVFSVWFWELNMEAINYIKQEVVMK